ncbi:hypothetical protein Ciccas_000517 [Cichlidogyrus casuarinus]|uniref:Sortilin N-terminal domain-containing protein n=1 Tax=Cichlidogyrus casuarinus TaxID=1844966 RepID=A0ABD2QPY6_9PLAT
MLFKLFLTINFLIHLDCLAIQEPDKKAASGYAEKEFMLLFDNGHYVYNTTTIFTTSDAGASFEIKQIINSTFLGHFERKPDVYIIFTVLTGDSKSNTTKVYLGETKDYGKAWKIQPIDLKPKNKHFDYRRDALKLHSFAGAESFMLIHDSSKNLYLSTNGGKKWEKVGNQVDDFFWNEYTKPNKREYSFFFLQTNNAFFRAEVVRCYSSSKPDCFIPIKINLVAYNISKVHRPLVHYWPNVENSSPKSTIFYLETFKHDSKPTLMSDPRDYMSNQTKLLDNKLVLYDGTTNIIKSVFLPVPKEYDVGALPFVI